MTAPTGSISLSQQHLRESLAACAAWRELCGSADNPASPAAALERTYLHGLPKPANGESYERQELQAYRPYAIVSTMQQDGLRWTREASGGSFGASGRMYLRIERESPDRQGDEPTADAMVTWTNIVGRIGDELCGLADQAGYLACGEIVPVDITYCPHPDLIETEGFWQSAEFLITW